MTLPPYVQAMLDKYVPGDRLASVTDAVTQLAAEAWDKGYVRADNGGDESENPYRP